LKRYNIGADPENALPLRRLPLALMTSDQVAARHWCDVDNCLPAVSPRGSKIRGSRGNCKSDQKVALALPFFKPKDPAPMFHSTNRYFTRGRTGQRAISSGVIARIAVLAMDEHLRGQAKRTCRDGPGVDGNGQLVDNLGRFSNCIDGY